VSGDGQADLVAAAAFADGPGNARIDAGEMHVLFGPFAQGASVDLGTVSADWTLLGAEAGDDLGFSVATGDVDLDGKGDLVIGAPKADGAGNAKLSSGEAYVFLAPLAPARHGDDWGVMPGMPRASTSSAATRA